MITMTRRACLKLFSVTGLSVALPPLAHASSQATTAKATQPASEPNGSVALDTADFEITLQRVIARTQAEDYALVTIRNTNDRQSTIRYIYPGVVEAEGNSYDLNALLPAGSLTIEARRNVYLRLKPMQRAADRQNPPVQIAQSGQAVIRNYLISSRNEQPHAVVRSVFV